MCSDKHKHIPPENPKNISDFFSLSRCIKSYIDRYKHSKPINYFISQIPFSDFPLGLCHDIKIQDQKHLL